MKQHQMYIKILCEKTNDYHTYNEKIRKMLQNEKDLCQEKDTNYASKLLEGFILLN